MIIGRYATLGVFLIVAVGKPREHVSLIRFAVRISIVHGEIMASYTIVYQEYTGHLFCDMPVPLIAAVVIAHLIPRGMQ
jgi:hypothetical protein